LSKLYQNHLELIEGTFRNITYPDLQKAVSLLDSGKKVHVYGIGNSGIAAQEFKWKFFRIGVNIELLPTRIRLSWMQRWRQKTA
jgi:DNA-binding MurR/RpiR family transcriptional regulator